MNKLKFYKLDRNHRRSERKSRIRLIMNSQSFRFSTFIKKANQTVQAVKELSAALVDVGKAISLLREIYFPEAYLISRSKSYYNGMDKN